MLDPVITDLQADEDPAITEIESVCVHCYQNGVTRLLLTRIAFFREVIISSFTCPHCGFENRSIDAAARVQDKGQRLTLKVSTAQDLNRRVVRPEASIIRLPSLEAEFPTSEGDLSTVEGVLQRIISSIENLQPQRRKVQPDLATKLEAFISRVRGLLAVDKPFTIILDDPSGNGFIENLLAPNPDPQLQCEQYERSREQDIALGLRSTDDDAAPAVASHLPTIAEDEPTPADNAPRSVGTDEVVTFAVDCPGCSAPAETNMKLVDIPHFKQVIIMATNCSACGHKDSEIKSGGGIADRGREYRLRLTHPSDLSRDVLVSETAAVLMPDLELESMGGTLGGRFTTLEGFLLAVRDQLIASNPFIVGDSASKQEGQSELGLLIDHLRKIAAGEMLNVQFVLRDPAGNSYLQNLYAPDPDPEMQVTDFDRSATENEELGLTDMNTTDYETVSPHTNRNS